MEAISTFSNVERIAFAFHESAPESVLLNNEPLFVSSNQTISRKNTQFVIDLINILQAKNIDFLACNTLNYPGWREFYEILESNTNVIVGASDDETGNLKYGGDWVMESTQEDVRDFTSLVTLRITVSCLYLSERAL